MKFSIVIPAHNEEEQLERTIFELMQELNSNKIDYEIVVVDDNSSDKTGEIIDNLAKKFNVIKPLHRRSEPGFGRAVRTGLSNVIGEVVAIVMADSSDDPRDVVKYFRKIEEGYDCVFGSRFIKGARIYDYPFLKLVINRLANNFIRLLFSIKDNDITNAFKAYRTEVIQAISPVESEHFNITVELPLKAIVKGFTYTVVPINWYGRKSGVSKLKLTVSMKKYFQTVIKIWIKSVFGFK